MYQIMILSKITGIKYTQLQTMILTIITDKYCREHMCKINVVCLVQTSKSY